MHTFGIYSPWSFQLYTLLFFFLFVLLKFPVSFHISFELRLDCFARYFGLGDYRIDWFISFIVFSELTRIVHFLVVGWSTFPKLDTLSIVTGYSWFICYWYFCTVEYYLLYNLYMVYPEMMEQYSCINRNVYLSKLVSHIFRQFIYLILFRFNCLLNNYRLYNLMVRFV